MWKFVMRFYKEILSQALHKSHRRVKSTITSSSACLHHGTVAAGALEPESLPEVRIGPISNPVVDADLGATFGTSLQGLLLS